MSLLTNLLINSKDTLAKKIKLLVATASLAAVCAPASAIDVVIVVDVTGSTGAVISSWRENMNTVVDPFLAVDPNARFALVTHKDFPFSPYGAPTDYPYQVEVALTTNLTTFYAALATLGSGGGADSPESQFEAIYQANTGAGRDLNNDGDYADAGDIPPQSLGFNPVTTSVTIHFTTPTDFHNEPYEPNYPYAGVVNHPATLADAKNAMLAQNNTYFA